jgi:hypothetical protein
LGRAKILPGSGEYLGYTSWSCPVGGVTEIDLIEIRIDLRRSIHHYGRRAVEAIGLTFGQPIVAMSRDETSDPFWRSLRWTAHTHPDDNQCRNYRTLVLAFAGIFTQARQSVVMRRTIYQTWYAEQP